MIFGQRWKQVRKILVGLQKGKSKPGREWATAKALRPVLPLRTGGGAGKLNPLTEWAQGSVRDVLRVQRSQ